jgi:HEAT repeat protein
MAAWALAAAPHRSTVSAALARAVRMDRDQNVRRTAVWALASGGECERDADAISALVLSLGDAEARVRELAAWASGTCRPTQAPGALVKALSDESRDVRIAAAWALYTIADPTAVPALDSAFRRETDPGVQRGLIRALGSAGDASVNVLQRLVSSPDNEIRKTAVTMLAGGQAWGPWPWPRPRPRPSP